MRGDRSGRGVRSEADMIFFLRIAFAAEILCNAMAKECQNVDNVWVPSLLCRRSWSLSVVVVVVRCGCRCPLSLSVVVVVVRCRCRCPLSLSFVVVVCRCRCRCLSLSLSIVYCRFVIVMVAVIATSECERHHEEWDACRLNLMKDMEVHMFIFKL